MISKAIIKDIQNLARKEGRVAQGRFVAEGTKWAMELLGSAPRQVQCVYALRSWLDAHAPLLSGIAVEEVDTVLLGRLSQLKSPAEVLVVARPFEHTIRPATEGLHLVLSTLQDPGNLGTLIRTADWFGIKQVVCSPDCADLYNPKVVQATMGSLVRMPVVYTSLTEWLSQQKGTRIWAAVLDGADYTTATGNGILMMGNEAKGLAKEMLDLATDRLTIPRIGGAESLNVSVAAGILMAQLAR